MKRTSVALLLFSLLFVAAAHTQTRKRTPIWLNVSADDDLGKSLAYDLRQEIARSSLHSLADSEDKTVFRLNIVTVSQSSGDANNSASAVSVVLLMKVAGDCDWGFPLMIDHWAVTVGANKTEVMARRIIAFVDSDLEKIRTAVESAK